MQRTLNAVLGYAVTRASRNIRLENRGSELIVSCLCRDDWETQMTLESASLNPLRATIRLLAHMNETQDRGAFGIDLRDAVLGLRIAFHVRVEIAPEDTIHLHLTLPDESDQDDQIAA